MIVIGAGRVGEALRRASTRCGASCRIVSRTTGWSYLEEEGGVPVLVAVRNHDLDEVISKVPRHRRDDLVFLQNGLFDPLLDRHDLGGCSRGLLYFAVPRWGDDLACGQTSWFTGPQGERVTSWMQGLGVKAASVERHVFGQHELEKVCWLVTHGLLCAVHKVTVGEVAEHHQEALLALTTELLEVAAVERDVGCDPASMVARLCSYSRTIPSFCASVKEWEWRDGWFVEAATKHGVHTPTHHGLLRSAGLTDRLPA